MAIKKLKKIQKSNHLNQANFSDLSLSTYRVILNLIAQLKKHDGEGNQLQLPVISRECTLSAKDFSEEFPGVGQQHAYEILKEATDKLLKTIFQIKTDIGILKIHVCSQVHYIEREGRIDIRFTEEIMPHLAELGNNFTMYNLKEISGFNSIYTTRLYELLMQFKTTGQYITTVDNLRYIFGCSNTFHRYNDFKKRTIHHAVNEINSQYEMNLSYEEIKEGRKVAKLIFYFKKTLVNLTYDPVKKKNRSQLIRPKMI
ncbi:MAG: replication initiation protein [Neisseriaceae bacterium]|jgi:plasmid replication initiation protein